MDLNAKVLELFDVKKLRKECNIKNCENPPTKEIMLSEKGMISSKSKTIASIHVCTEHLIKAKEIIETLNEELKGRIVQMDICEEEYVTY